MKIRPIHSEADYKTALKRVSVLVDVDPAVGSPEGDELGLIGALVEAYEAEHFPLEVPDSIEAIKFRMEQQGIKLRTSNQ